MKFDNEEYKVKREAYLATYKKIEPYFSRRTLTTDEELLKSYKAELIERHNDYIDYLAETFDGVDDHGQKVFDERAEKIVEKTKKCLIVLKLRYDWPVNIYEQVDESKITTATQVEDESDSDTVESEPEVNMSHLSLQEFIKTAGTIINYKFNGEPLELEGFLADVEMILQLATNDSLKEFSVAYIKGKLRGKALECLPDEVNTVDEIKKALKEKIRPFSSKVVESKIRALRLVKGNFIKFAKEAEDLAEQFRRSLVVEGNSKAKSEEMAIEMTRELCRNTARSPIVKSVIESSDFKSPADVVAKLVTQSDKAKREQKEAENYKNSQANRNNNGNKNFGNNKRYQNNQSRNNGNSNSNSYSSFNNGQSGSGSNRPRYNKNGNNNNNNNNRNNNNNNNNNNNGNWRRNNNNNRVEHTIRLLQGNQQAPSSDGQDQNPYMQTR